MPQSTGWKLDFTIYMDIILRVFISIMSIPFLKISFINFLSEIYAPKYIDFFP